MTVIERETIERGRRWRDADRWDGARRIANKHRINPDVGGKNFGKRPQAVKQCVCVFV